MRIRRSLAIVSALVITAAIAAGGTLFANSASAGIYSDKCGPGFTLKRVEKIYDQGEHMGSLRLYINKERHYCLLTTRAPRFRDKQGFVYSEIEGNQVRSNVYRFGAVQRTKSAGCFAYRGGVYRVHHKRYASIERNTCNRPQNEM